MLMVFLNRCCIQSGKVIRGWYIYVFKKTGTSMQNRERGCIPFCQQWERSALQNVNEGKARVAIEIGKMRTIDSLTTMKRK